MPYHGMKCVGIFTSGYAMQVNKRLLIYCKMILHPQSCTRSTSNTDRLSEQQNTGVMAAPHYCRVLQ